MTMKKLIYPCIPHEENNLSLMLVYLLSNQERNKEETIQNYCGQFYLSIGVIIQIKLMLM